MLCEVISQSAALLGKGHRLKACLMVDARFGNRTELKLIAFSFLLNLVWR